MRIAAGDTSGHASMHDCTAADSKPPALEHMKSDIIEASSIARAAELRPVFPSAMSDGKNFAYPPHQRPGHGAVAVGVEVNAVEPRRADVRQVDKFAAEPPCLTLI